MVVTQTAVAAGPDQRVGVGNQTRWADPVSVRPPRKRATINGSVDSGQSCCPGQDGKVVRFRNAPGAHYPNAERQAESSRMLLCHAWEPTERSIERHGGSTTLGGERPRRVARTFGTHSSPRLDPHLHDRIPTFMSRLYFPPVGLTIHRWQGRRAALGSRSCRTFRASVRYPPVTARLQDVSLIHTESDGALLRSLPTRWPTPRCCEPVH